ncbi:hypothetical protein OBE_04118, partial [human gut metagenome]
WTRYYVCGDSWTIREIEPSITNLLMVDNHIPAGAKLY